MASKEVGARAASRAPTAGPPAAHHSRAGQTVLPQSLQLGTTSRQPVAS